MRNVLMHCNCISPTWLINHFCHYDGNRPVTDFRFSCNIDRSCSVNEKQNHLLQQAKSEETDVFTSLLALLLNLGELSPGLSSGGKSLTAIGLSLCITA